MQLHAITAAVSWVLGDNHDLPAAFAQFARAASPVAVDAMWQGAAVLLGLFFSLRLAPRVSAAHRFAAWAVGFTVVAALPFVPALIHLMVGAMAPERAAAAIAAAGAGAASAAPKAWLHIDSGWALAIAGLWILGSAFRFAELVFHTLRLRKLWRTATPVAHETIALPRGIALCTTRALDRPSVIGFFAPRVLIPEWLYARLSPQELQQVVLHEVEHLRRHDDWTNLIQKLVLVLFPLNPALAWIERRLCREREMACDEGVVSRTRAPRAYAACLASLAERGLQRESERRAAALSLAAWRGRPELVRRVHSILWRKPALQPVAARALLGVFACGLIVGSVELARCPQIVAFVSAPAPQIGVQGDAVIREQAALSLNGSGVRMIPAKAILPDAVLPDGKSEAAVAARPLALRTASAPEHEIAMRDGDGFSAHETLLKAVMPAANAEQTPQSGSAQSEPAQSEFAEPGLAEPGPGQQYRGQQYIVLTTWEQVDDPAQNARAISDYDTNAAADQQSPAQPGNAQVAHVTITRLVFRVESEAPAAAKNPAGDASNDANNAASAAATATGKTAAASNNSPTPSTYGRQRVAIPVANGWLVFQL